jgi:CcmD family protein
MIKIVIIISFLIVLGFFFFVTLPVSLTEDEVSEAVSNVVSKSKVAVDEDLAEQLALQLVEELENEQSKRLKYLASAYLVIWLVFMLYLLRLGKQQQTLAQRLSQLGQDTEESLE